MYLAGTALALPGGMAAAVAPVLPLAGLLRRRGAGRPVAVRFLLGCLFAALALAAGWLTTFSISQSAAGSIALLACTVGLIDVLRSTRPVGKGAFLAVAAAVIVILVFVAAVGSTAPRGLVVVVLCGYAAIRVIWYGRHVLERCDAERQQAFAETALVGQRVTSSLLEKAAELSAKAARPIDDVRASAAYRRVVAKVLARRVLEECARPAGGGVS